MKSALLLACCLLTLFCFSQCRYGIVKSYGYKQPDYAGNIPKDGQGRRGVSMVYKVFLETKKNTKPEWTKAVVGNKNYSVIETPMESPVFVGMLQNSNDSVVLRAKKTSKIWQLNLESAKETSQTNDTAVDVNAIVLQGRWGKKKVSYTVKPLKTLQPVMHE